VGAMKLYGEQTGRWPFLADSSSIKNRRSYSRTAPGTETVVVTITDRVFVLEVVPSGLHERGRERVEGRAGMSIKMT